MLNGSKLLFLDLAACPAVVSRLCVGRLVLKKREHGAHELRQLVGEHSKVPRGLRDGQCLRVSWECSHLLGS